MKKKKPYESPELDIYELILADRLMSYSDGVSLEDDVGETLVDPEF